MSRLTQSEFLLWSVDGYTQPVNSAIQFGSQNPASFPFNLDGYTISSSFVSAPFRLKQVDKYVIVLSAPASSTISATLQFQGCIDKPWHAETTDAGLQNWYPIYYVPQVGGSPTDIFTITSGAILNTFKEPDCDYQFVRLVMTVASGSGALTARISFKGDLG
jgi:hypothetical protein